MNKTAIIVIALIVVVVGVYLYMKNSGNDKTTSTTTQTKSGLAGLDLSGILGGLINRNQNSDTDPHAAAHAASGGAQPVPNLIDVDNA